MRRLRKTFAADESGSTAIEYALILILCSVVIVASLYSTRDSLNQGMGQVSTELQSATN